MSTVSSDIAEPKGQKEWGILAGLVVYLLAMLSPAWILPFLKSFLTTSLFSVNTKNSILQIIFICTNFLVIFLAFKFFGRRVRDAGFTAIRARYLAVALLGFVVYITLSLILLYIGSHFFGVNQAEPQNLGYNSGLHNLTDILVAFVPLVLLTPVIEEMLFRGFIFEGFRHKLPFWPAAILVSGLFGLAHGQWNVGVDVFALSIVSCYLRDRTKSLWPSIFLHALKNAMAFYLLYLYNGG